MSNNKIHAIWLGNKLTPLALVCIEDWKKQGYEYKVWKEEDSLITEWIDGCEFAKECYKRGLYAFVTDYLRLKILQHEGGLYLDTDVTVQKNPFPLFEECQFAVGYESESMIGTACIYAQKESKILANLIDFYEHKILSSPLYMGPGIMTHVLIDNEMKDIEKSLIFPVEYFYCYLGNGQEFTTPDNSYLVHWFQHSWKDPRKAIYLKSKHMGLLGKIYTWQKYIFKKRK